MSTVLLVGSVVLASVTYAMVGSDVRGAEPGQDLQGIVGSAVKIQVPPTPAPEQLVVNETLLSAEVALSQPLPSMLVQIPTPQIICGMKVWRVDPGIDPGIQRPLPGGAAGAMIRRIPARQCVESTAGRYVVETISGARREIPIKPSSGTKRPDR